MADFVAVIRRAVDGLTDNTPEMRAKVYEKARSAVVRQLENMNPRPPEAMFKRQLDKLDDAARIVEEEHSVAVPAENLPENAVDPISSTPDAASDHRPPAAREEEPAAISEPSAVHETIATPEPASAQDPVETVATSWTGAPAPASVDDGTPSDPVLAHTQTAEIVPAYKPPIDEKPFLYRTAELQDVGSENLAEGGSFEVPSHDASSAHDDKAPGAQEQEFSEDHDRSPATENIYAAQADDYHESAPLQMARHDAEEPAPAFPAGAPVEALVSHVEEAREPAIRHASNRVMEQPHVGSESEFPGGEPVIDPTLAVETTPLDRPIAAMPDWGVDIDREPEVHGDADAAAMPQMPRAALTESDVASGFNDFLKTEFSTPAVKPPPVRKEPDSGFSWDEPFDDLPDLPKPVAFDQALSARQEEMARPASTKVEGERQRDARSELEDLIGYRPADGQTASGDQLPPDVTRAMSRLEGKSFKVSRKDKQRFNPIPIAFGVGAALVVAGGAFAAYTYRDDVTAIVATLMPSETAPATTAAETRAVAEAEATPSDAKSVTVRTEDAATATAPSQNIEDKPTEVASLDTNIAPTKFTQRLLADGTESETDAAKIPVDQSLTEGKTIAGQTVAPETEVAATETSQAVTSDAVATPGLIVAQKMILYEERLGDSPVAIQGKVSWALKPDTTSGKAQSMVEGIVEVPERKLKAVVSFKRNSDPSLPASHIIEVVFDLPKDFAEGNVESVQRVAFKQTEQDRGNSLIAVPAKITDDFHMIALNDDADARKVNSDLMKNRSWIDIPVVYRNNRRALLTFEKGTTGTEAFDKALAEWAALGPTANN